MADIVLNITIKDAHKVRILNALTNYADKLIAFSISTGEKSDFWDFTYTPQNGATPKVFAQNVIKQFLLALTKCYEYEVDLKRYKSEIDAISPATQTVLDEMID